MGQARDSKPGAAGRRLLCRTPLRPDKGTPGEIRGRKATGLPLATGGLWQPGCQERGKTPPPCCRGCFICAGQSWSGKAEVEAMNWLHGALALAVWAILAIGPLWHAARAG